MREDNYLYELKNLYNQDDNIGKKYWKHFFQILELASGRSKGEGNIHTYNKEDYLYYLNNILRFFIKNNIFKKTNDLVKISSHSDSKNIQYGGKEYEIEFQIIDREKVSEILDFFPHFSNMSSSELIIEKEYKIGSIEDSIVVKKIPKGLLIQKQGNNGKMYIDIKTAPKLLKLFSVLTNLEKYSIKSSSLLKMKFITSQGALDKYICDLRDFLGDTLNGEGDYKYLVKGNSEGATTYRLLNIKITEFDF